MSALPPKADMCGATRNVRYGPIADITSVNFNGRFTPASKHLSLRVDVGCYSIGCKYFWGRGRYIRGNARRVFFEHKA
jgi:hypothetical protein